MRLTKFDIYSSSEICLSFPDTIQKGKKREEKTYAKKLLQCLNNFEALEKKGTGLPSFRLLKPTLGGEGKHHKKTNRLRKSEIQVYHYVQQTTTRGGKKRREMKR